MKKIALKIDTINLPQDDSFISLIKSILCKNIGSNGDISSILVQIAKVDDVRIPYKTTIDLVLNSSKASLQSESSSAHYLSSFTHALSRMQRQLSRE